MHPPLALIPRECTKDWKVPDSDVVIKQGTHVFLPIYGLHHDPKYFPEPEVFNPDRFEASNLADKTLITMPYLPFGDGPRACIGIRLGIMQVKVGLILLLRSYKFELSGNTIKSLEYVVNSQILAPVGGIELKVLRRAK